MSIRRIALVLLVSFLGNLLVAGSGIAAFRDCVSHQEHEASSLENVAGQAGGEHKSAYAHGCHASHYLQAFLAVRAAALPDPQAARFALAFFSKPSTVISPPLLRPPRPLPL